MKKYVNPQLEIIDIANDEIISTSGPVVDKIQKSSLFTEGEGSDEIL